MIDSKEKLYECIELEKQLYMGIGYKGKIHFIVTQCEIGKLYQFIFALRKDEYYSNTVSKSSVHKLLAVYYRRKHNILGIRLGLSIPINTFGKGLLIYHSQGIIVHRDSRCGEYCKLHGLNCIGNNGAGGGLNNSPEIGNSLDLGVGAKIIGNVVLPDYTTVAAGAVVCKSFNTKYQVLAGVPAKLLKVKNVEEK